MTSSFFQALLHNSFLQVALIAAVLSSIASGIMGSYVVIKRISSLSGSISHSILGGIGFFLWLQYNHSQAWADPLYGAFLSALLAALLIGYIHLKHRQNEDAIIATIWSAGMGIGVIFVSLIEGYKADFSAFLFGNLLFISEKNLWMLLVLDGVILLSTLLFYKKFLSVCFDEEQAKLQGIKISLYYFFLLGLIAISIVLLIQTIGIILVIALLTIPPTISLLFTKKLPKVMMLSCLIALLINLIGIYLSYEKGLPPGATIAILACAAYGLALIIKKKQLRYKI